MKRPVTMVVLTKYPDIWSRFKDNVGKLFDPETYYRVVVLDGKLIAEPKDWKIVYGPKQFSMAGNANLGWKAVGPDSDLLYVGDDVTFYTADTIEKLSELAYSRNDIGILSPKINGGASNPLQKDPPDTDIVYSEQYLALICTYVKRSTLNRVGFLDDQTFKGYGWDDADYCRRVRNAGLKLAITPRVEVGHGTDHQGTETFIRNASGYYEDIQIQCDENEKAYIKKWGDNK